MSSAAIIPAMAKNTVASANSRPGQSLYAACMSPTTVRNPQLSGINHLRPCPKIKFLGSAISDGSCSGFRKRSGRKLSGSSQFWLLMLIDLCDGNLMSMEDLLALTEYPHHILVMIVVSAGIQ